MSVPDADRPGTPRAVPELPRAEMGEWTDAFDDLLARHGPGGAAAVLGQLRLHAVRSGIPASPVTDAVNTIPVERQPPYPGDLELEERIERLVRWNALAIVVRANREYPGIGGHISSFASAATLFEVGFQHFWRAPKEDHPGDLVLLQGHSSPGVYARAFLEGRLDEDALGHFRRETGGEGLSSYPHPWLMPGFWQFPTVSMGLAPVIAVYLARFQRYLEHAQLVAPSDRRVWCVIGDGECDEPEAAGCLGIAAREGLDNLVFVVDGNLQRLDGPVRGNTHVIRELEGRFRGAGWNVLKVLWGSDWDALFASDVDGALVRRLTAAVDGELQKSVAAPGAWSREHLFNTPELRGMVSHLADDQLPHLSRGGHDRSKVYAAYRAAVDHRGGPSVVLAHTVKGYGLRAAGEASNIAHKRKKLTGTELRDVRSRFGLPLDDAQADEAAFLRPADDAPEMRYLRERRAELGGPLPARLEDDDALETPGLDEFNDRLGGSGEREEATTMGFVRLLRDLMKHPALGRHVVPIVPDEARTFGMDALFHEFGIYEPGGQLYEPVDADSVLHYRESAEGQLLEEGITEAGAMGSFIAAGSSYAHLGLPMVPFFVFYSMFGFQRVGDLIWAAADSRCRGFLLGATAGRTTLNGEGLQHQDGHSQILASTVPSLRAYDPAFTAELTVIVQDGLRRMLEDREPLQVYLTLYNEPFTMPALDRGNAEGVRRGLYRLRSRGGGARVQLLGSGAILREVLRAQELLDEHYDVGSDVWSVTSWSELRRDALAVERRDLLTGQRGEERSWVERCFESVDGPTVAASDWMRIVPDQIARWVPGPFVPLGTDGFGRSDTRAALRRFFEIDAQHVAYAALSALSACGGCDGRTLRGARERFSIDPETPDPARS